MLGSVGRIGRQSRLRSSALPPSALLAHTARLTVVGNSYMSQAGNIDVVQWLRIGMGCRGAPSVALRLATGGDRFTHALNRIAPINGVRAAAQDFMNPENEYGQVANTAAGGEAMFANLQAYIAAARAVTPGVHIQVAKGANTVGRSSKPLAAARYEALLADLDASDPLISIHDEALVFNAADSAQSGDGTHPNRRRSARGLGLSKGAALAALFDPADIFANGPQLPNALNRTGVPGATVFSSAAAWSITANSSGLAASQAAGVMASRPTMPARRFTISGTCAADETLNTQAPDLSGALTFNLPNGHSTFGKHYACVLLVEVTNAAGDGPPVNLASLSFSLGNVANLFTKQVTASHQSDWSESLIGPIELTPAAGPATSQFGSLSLTWVARGKNGQVIDVGLAVGAVNIIETEAAAYGTPSFTARTYNVGQPLIGFVPTMTPASGTYGVGTAININSPGTVVGGGLARTFEVVNEANQVVGTCTAPASGVAAVPYIVQASDVGTGKTLRVRSHAVNAFGADVMDTLPRPSA